MLFYKKSAAGSEPPVLDARRIGIAGALLVVLVIASFVAYGIGWGEAATFFLNVFGFGISGVFGVILGEGITR